jgi:hypothetical protein
MKCSHETVAREAQPDEALVVEVFILFVAVCVHVWT